MRSDAKVVKKTLCDLMEEEDVSNSQLAFGDYEENFRDLIISSLGEFEMAQEALRTSGDGDYNGAQAVLYFKRHDVYISVEGYYMSDEGMTFENLDIVEPEVVTETIYVSKKD